MHQKSKSYIYFKRTSSAKIDRQIGRQTKKNSINVHGGDIVTYRYLQTQVVYIHVSYYSSIVSDLSCDLFS